MIVTREDLTGQKFGLLTVVKQTEDYIGKNGNRLSAWECLCDCGKQKNVPGAWLKQGYVKSCGCLHSATSINYGVNTYEFKEDYIIGHDMSDNVFYVDLEDFDRIKNDYWSMDVNGYISKDSRKEKMHRFIMECNDKNMVVDHINHVKYDNRKSNLRVVSRNKNAQNMKVFANNKEGVTGVRWHKRHNKWIANITVNGRLLHLGYFDKFEDAVKVRKNAEELYFGEYSYNNSINKTSNESENMDITMCMSKECPERKNCYRAMAIPDRYQSYANYEYICNEESGFEDFMPILPGDTIQN